MFRRIDDFIAALQQETDSTLAVLNVLTDESLSTRATKRTRSLGELAWHLAYTLSEMPAGAGLRVPHLAEKPVPDAATIAASYRQAADDLATAVRDEWTDESLGEEFDLYGERWTRAHLLTVLMLHQAHHRGQMTMLMRMAGLPVPGVYGPSREEAEAMQPPVPPQ